jgi:hypothetical protein
MGAIAVGSSGTPLHAASISTAALQSINVLAPCRRDFHCRA